MLFLNYDKMHNIATSTSNVTFDSTTESEIAENHISTISLKVKSEHRNLHNKSSLTLTSLINFDNIFEKDELQAFEGPSTSKEITPAEFTVIYKNADSNKSKTPEYNETEDKLIPPPYSLYNCELYTDLNRDIFEPTEFEITPPLCPPIVLYSAPPLHGAPPTYSAIMRIGPIEIQPRRSLRIFGRREVRMQPSPPFIAPMPPPSYAETQGLCMNQARPNYGNGNLEIEDCVWGPDPTSVICPTCNNFVISTVHTRRSHLTHFSALALCICGCWPCCLLPYCMKACQTTYHECPLCFSVIGMYNPW